MRLRYDDVAGCEDVDRATGRPTDGIVDVDVLMIGRKRMTRRAHVAQWHPAKEIGEGDRRYREDGSRCTARHRASWGAIVRGRSRGSIGFVGSGDAVAATGNRGKCDEYSFAMPNRSLELSDVKTVASYCGG